ncbi:MAG: hypothetical protein RMJ44_01630 [Cytophagales bacterium]|nr:hypothetical protein [Bernardetiaceae bacterium]MDW8209762.1 hypothetical protein [Cytophagales bacterium]
MKNTQTQRKGELSEFLSVDENGRLVGEEKLLTPSERKSNRWVAGMLVVSFFAMVAIVIGSVSWLLSLQTPFEGANAWLISGSLLFFTLLFPIVFFICAFGSLMRLK